MSNREKGVASVACATCADDLVLSAQLDGSIAAESCSSCYPAQPKAEVASGPSAPRERGTHLKENSDG